MVSSQELSEKNFKEKFWFTKGLKRKKIFLFFLCKNGVKILPCHIDKKFNLPETKLFLNTNLQKNVKLGSMQFVHSTFLGVLSLFLNQKLTVKINIPKYCTRTEL
jgi:hypothetical protein